MNSTNCILDPFRTVVLKRCLPAIVPHITAIVNVSFETGVVPSALKMAAVVPVLKKTGSDTADMSNYRPISNVPFLAKVLERVVIGQMQSHLSMNCLLEPFQSGFRSGHKIKTWMKHNFLKLNCSKTEILQIGTPNAVSKFNNLELYVDDSLIIPANHVQNLGVFFDVQLSFTTHFKNITKVAFFHLRNIASIRTFLSLPDAERLIYAFIISRLDYCNSLFVGLPANSIKRLQYIQNSVARVLTHTSSRQHITRFFSQLHWLPVQSRIYFKILILTYKAVHGLAPVYICDLVTLYTSSRSLRSAGSISLYQTLCKLKAIGPSLALLLGWFILLRLCLWVHARASYGDGRTAVCQHTRT
ncbi:RTJK polymerase, partial [Amia calva]|nr:RTJK polymerase [Amia calva]